MAIRFVRHAVSCVLGVTLTLAGVARAAIAQNVPAQHSGDMVRVPAGSYVPLREVGTAHAIRVAAFRLDRRAVTRGEFVAFVHGNAEWRRDRVRGDQAASGYLAEWPGVLDAGSADDLAKPVTSVSWFAARAYCANEGKRLPRVDEWEYVAAASETKRDATGDPKFAQRLLQLYGAEALERLRAGRGFRNVYGVEGLHGGPWEWAEDFDNVLIAGEARQATGTSRPTDANAVCAAASIGASDPSNYPAFLRFAFRNALNQRTTMTMLGFRCAANA